MKRLTKKQTEVATEMLAFLCEKFPLTFSPWGSDCKPLKIGVDADIRRVTGVGKKKVEIVLSRYTVTKRYLEAVMRRQDSVDLNGNYAGPVTEKQAELACKHARSRSDMAPERIERAMKTL